MLFQIQDTNRELMVHQSSMSAELSAGFVIIPSTNPTFFHALKEAVRTERTHSL